MTVRPIAGERVEDFEARKPPAILSSAAFIAGFKPPDYLIKGVLQRRFFYSLTAQTGHGKTAIALLLVANIATGQPFAGRSVSRGPVLYLAGENPDDVRMRWIAASEQLGFNLDTIDVHFVPGVFSIPGMLRAVRQKAEEVGGLSLIVVDTTAAYFEGEEENSNTQLGAHARNIRALTGVSGGPCVIACSHPTKGAGTDNLVPRGGGAFLNETDGNLTCVKDDTVVTLHWQGKFRGPNFDPIALEIVSVTSARLVDADGDPIPTVMARAISEDEQRLHEKSARSDEDRLLTAMRDFPGSSFGKLAEIIGWPNKSRVARTMDRLKQDNMVEKKRGHYRLTRAGKAEAERTGPL